MLLNLADSAFLPYNLEHLPRVMEEGLADLSSSANVARMFKENNVTLSHLEKAVEEFKKASEEFAKRLENSVLFLKNILQCEGNSLLEKDEKSGQERRHGSEGGQRPGMEKKSKDPPNFSSPSNFWEIAIEGLQFSHFQLMHLERAFLLERGLPPDHNPDSLHAVLAPSRRNSYGTETFPGIDNLLEGMQEMKGKAKEER